MRKSILLSTLLSLVILASSSGLFLTFLIKQAVIRNEVKEKIISGLPKSSLTLFKKSGENGSILLKWFREKEFSHDGKMYDVVTEEKHGDTTWYYCFLDEKESSLFSRMDELTKSVLRNDRNFKGLISRISNFLFQDFISVIKDNLKQFQRALDLHFTGYFFSVKTFVPAPLSPPP